MIREIKDGEGNLLAMLVMEKELRGDGVKFFTFGELSQQVAYIHHHAGKHVDAHLHNLVNRSITQTQEVLVVKKGLMIANFYDAAKRYVGYFVVAAGDVLIIVSGGHGFQVLSELEMIEVKQGPYAGDDDKTRFVPEPMLDNGGGAWRG